MTITALGPRARSRAVTIAAAGAALGLVGIGSARAGARDTVFAATPGPQTIGLTMNAVTAVSRHDAWAVGTLHREGKPNATPHAAVVHWDGSSWSSVAAPAGADELTSVAALSPHDIWVGGFRSALFGPTRVWNFNGHHWSAVPAAGLPSGITARVVANDHHVWLIGEVDPGRRIAGAVVALYDPSAKRWSVDDLSRVGGFVGGTAVGSKQAWAVGSTSKYDDLGHPLIAHWNGRHWMVRTFPRVLGQLTEVAGHSTEDIVAVGYNGTKAFGDDPAHPQGGIGLAWNGNAWRTMTMGKHDGLDNFTSLAPGPGEEYWAGITGRGRLNSANYLHYNGGRWVHARSPRISAQPTASYFEQTPVVLGMAHVPGTKITLAVGEAAYDFREPATNVLPFWEHTTR